MAVIGDGSAPSGQVAISSSNVIPTQTRSRVRQGRAASISIYNNTLQLARLSWIPQFNTNQLSSSPVPDLVVQRDVRLPNVSFGVQPAIFTVALDFAQVPAKDFHYFPALADELQLQILQIAFRKGRLVEIRSPNPPWPFVLQDVIIKKGLWAQPHPLMSVCFKFREEALKFYLMIFSIRLGAPVVNFSSARLGSGSGYVSYDFDDLAKASPTLVYFNHDFDTLVVPSEVLQLNRRRFRIGGLDRVQHMTVLCQKHIDTTTMWRLSRLENLKSPLGIALNEPERGRRKNTYTEARICRFAAGGDNSVALAIRGEMLVLSGRRTIDQIPDVEIQHYHRFNGNATPSFCSKWVSAWKNIRTRFTAMDHRGLGGGRTSRPTARRS